MVYIWQGVHIWRPHPSSTCFVLSKIKIHSSLASILLASSFTKCETISTNSQICKIGFRSEASEPEPNSSLEKEVEELKKRMNRVMDGYIETPESHPAYQDEWKKFWCAKFKKLRKEGKEDPFKYDYKPEWIIFWNVRVKVLFVEEFESKMNALKKKYQLSDCKKEEKVSFLYFSNSKNRFYFWEMLVCGIICALVKRFRKFCSQSKKFPRNHLAYLRNRCLTLKRS